MPFMPEEGEGCVLDARRERSAPSQARLARLSRLMTSATFDVPLSEIERPNRAAAPCCEARHVAMYLSHVVFQIPLPVIARDFGRDRTSVGHAVRRIEDRRDDRAFDQKLERLERLAEGYIDALIAEREEGR